MLRRYHGNLEKGASSGSTDLLPAPGATTNWTASLLTDSGRDSDLIFRFDGRQAAKVPDWLVPQNLTDQFTIATWMKHGPSPGLRAEKETLLCNSDKTGEREPRGGGGFGGRPVFPRRTGNQTPTVRAGLAIGPTGQCLVGWQAFRADEVYS